MKKLLLTFLALTLPFQSVWGGSQCMTLQETIYLPMVEFYHSYGIDTYMSLHCARNSRNFFESNQDQIKSLFQDASALIIANRNLDETIFPQSARHGSLDSWTYHVVLVLDGLIIDMDYRLLDAVGVPHYRNLPAIESIDQYLNKMWGEFKNSLVFQVRPAGKIHDLTEMEIDSSFENKEYLIFNHSELIDYFSATPCLKKKPYYILEKSQPY